MATPNPTQPIITDPDGRLRFKENRIVSHLLGHGGISMNDLARMDFSQDDREQFAQLIGYSLGGFADLSYVSDETYARAQTTVADTERLDFMTSRGAWIAHSKDGETCRVFVQPENDDPEPIMGWGAKDAWYDDPRKAIDAAMLKERGK